jgi:integrase/recombinase XerD
MSRRRSSEDIPSARSFTPAQLTMIADAWIESRLKRGYNVIGCRVYARELASFRAALKEVGLDLDSPSPAIAAAATAWAQQTTSQGQLCTAKACTQRLASIRSFYRYAIETNLFTGKNPISLRKPYTARDPRRSYLPSTAQVREALAQIDRSSIVGKRDYALLTTGILLLCHCAELSLLRRWDIEWTADGLLVLTWRSTPGATSAGDVLPRPVSQALLDWLESFYGQALDSIPVAAPLWPRSPSPPDQYHAMSRADIVQLSKQRLGTHEVHALREIGTQLMCECGASSHDIKARLERSPTSTQRLTAQPADVCPWLAAMAEHLGLSLHQQLLAQEQRAEGSFAL